MVQRTSATATPKYKCAYTHRIRVPALTSAHRGIVGSARVILHEEGVRGFYKGILPQLYALGPNWAVYDG